MNINVKLHHEDIYDSKKGSIKMRGEMPMKTNFTYSDEN